MPAATSLPVGFHVLEHRPRHGNPTAALPRVILVHGSLDRASSFARVVRRLDDLEVVTYDRRGYAGSRSVSPPALDLDRHVDDLLALVGTGPAVVVGHSLGGDVALGAAIEAPGPVTAVGAFEPPMPWLDWWPRRGRAGLAGLDPAEYAESFFRRMVGPDSWDRLPEAFRAARRADGPALLAELMAIRGEDPPFDLGRLRVPAVFGFGSRTLEHHRRGVEALVGLVPGAEPFEITGAAHGAHLSHPDTFAEFVRRVLALGAGA